MMYAKLMTSLLALTFIVFVGGCDSEFDETSNLAASDEPAGDVAAGKVKSAMCSACHGADGISVSPTYPNLAGQKEMYLVQQLNNFNSGVREDPIMGPMSMEVSDVDIEDIAAYYASLSDLAGSNEPAGDVAAGKAKSAMCSACHGADGVSVNPTYPNLAGQKEMYLVQQLNNFNSGVRKDPIMGPMSMGLSDVDIKNLAAYYASLR